MSTSSAGSGLFYLWEVGDTLPVPARIQKLSFISGDTGGTSTVTINGVTFWSAVISAGQTGEFNFPTPLAVDSLSLSAVGTNVILMVTTV